MPNLVVVSTPAFGVRVVGFKSIAAYAHRRAWRILPPYWAALGFSLMMTWYVLAQPGWPAIESM